MIHNVFAAQGLATEVAADRLPSKEVVLQAQGLETKTAMMHSAKWGIQSELAPMQLSAFHAASAYDQDEQVICAMKAPALNGCNESLNADQELQKCGARAAAGYAVAGSEADVAPAGIRRAASCRLPMTKPPAADPDFDFQAAQSARDALKELQAWKDCRPLGLECEAPVSLFCVAALHPKVRKSATWPKAQFSKFISA